MNNSKLLNSYVNLTSNLSSINDKSLAISEIKDLCYSKNVIEILQNISNSSNYFILDIYLEFIYSNIDSIEIIESERCTFMELLWMYDLKDEFIHLVKTNYAKELTESIQIIIKQLNFEKIPELSGQLESKSGSEILLLSHIRNNERTRIIDLTLINFYTSNIVNSALVNTAALRYLYNHKLFDDLLLKFENDSSLHSSPPASVFYLFTLYHLNRTDEFWEYYHELSAKLSVLQGTSLEQFLRRELDVATEFIEIEKNKILKEIELHSDHLFLIYKALGEISTGSIIPENILTHNFLTEIVLTATLRFFREENYSQNDIQILIQFLKSKKDARAEIFNKNVSPEVLENWFGYEVGECRIENGLPIGVLIYEAFDVSPIKQTYSTILLEQINIWGGQRTLDFFIDSVFTGELLNLTIFSITRGVIDSYKSEMTLANHPSITHLKSLKITHLHASPGFYISILNSKFCNLKLLHLNYVHSLSTFNEGLRLDDLIKQNESVHAIYELHLEGSIHENQLSFLKATDFKNLQELNLSQNELNSTSIENMLGAKWFKKLKVLNLSNTGIEAMILEQLIEFPELVGSLEHLIVYSEEILPVDLISDFKNKYSTIQIDYTSDQE